MGTVVKVAIGTALGILLAGAVVVAALAVSSDWSLDSSEGPGERAARAGATPSPSPAPMATVQPKAKSRPASRPSRPKAKPSAKPSLVACDANIRVKASTTTCEFAQNAFYTYWSYLGEGISPIPVWSPAAGDVFATTCSEAATIVCKAEDGGEVRFPSGAIDAYDQDQAERYLATHDVGPRTGSGLCSFDERWCLADNEPSPPRSSDCDPNYAGACLDPASYDYDCEGGSGDGPDYTGTVRVVGDDPFDLDRDGDGIACDV